MNQPAWYLVLFLWLLPRILLAQEDLMKLLEEKTSQEQEIEYTHSTFKATRVINGQSIETTSAGTLSFIIAHRFGKINDGIQELFGLDQATIRFGLEYGITDHLNIGLGRGSFQKTYDAYIKYKLLRQSTGARKFPISAVLYSTIAANGADFPDPDRENYFSSRLSFTHQILLARKFNTNFSLQLTPTMVHRNLVAAINDENDVYALGFGARFKLSKRVTLNGEYFYQLPGANRDQTYNGIALGFDIETGGHVFQLHVTNSQGMIERYFVTETFGDFWQGDIYFGFNINRVFTIVGKEESK